MSLGKYRTRIHVRGLGTIMAREVEPTSGAFSDLGYLQDISIADIQEMDEVHNDKGELIQALRTNRRAGAEANLMQVSKDEIDFLVGCADKVHAIRYCGLTDTNVYQYWCFEAAKITPDVKLTYVVGRRLLPIRFVALKQSSLAYDVPLYYLVQLDREMSTSMLHLYVPFYDGKNYLTAYGLDFSGYARHGTVSADYATMWQLATALYFMRFDGTNDDVSFGDILDDDGSMDYVIEAWVRVMGANGGQEEILAKKEIISDHTAGYSLVRSAGNKLVFKLSTGAASVSVTSASDILQNVWAHVAVAVDRNGNASTYINGAVDGTPGAVSALATGTNAFNLYLGRESKAASGLFGQVDIGMVRIYQYAAGGLPSDITTILLNHYNGEKAKFGL